MRLRFHGRAAGAALLPPAVHAVVMAAALMLLATDAVAAVPVEESIAADRRGAPRAATPVYPQYPQESTAVQAPEPSQPASDARRLSELFYQLQVLAQEVQELRGAFEEQSHRLNRIARDQQEQYIDLDRRVASLRNNTAAPAISTPTRSVTSGPAAPTASGSATERGAYTDAFNFMKNKRFDESADAFNRLIVEYPNGQYTPNAFYWLGELYLAKQEHEKARQSFMQVTNLYPDHQKVPDALYKLGVVYDRLGDTQRSLEYLGRVKAQHPQSSAAGLAETYAAELR